MFDPVSSRVSFPNLENDILQWWREHDIFRRTETEREGRPLFVLYDGPPTANGRPGIHHVLARVFKDVIPRHRTMKGFKPFRKAGWDTHGLPVEVEIERELKLRSKREIEQYGIEAFNEKCRESVWRYIGDWRALTERIAFWIDMDDPYVTLDNEYIETGWWILKTLWDRDLLFQDLKGAPHCPRCVTTLSSHEVAQGYRENTRDPSVFVKFPVACAADPSNPPPSLGALAPADERPAALLAWTTTPWTLPGNTALAVMPDADYAIVDVWAEENDDPDRLVLAHALLDRALKDKYQVVGSVKGRDLVGLTYTLPYAPWENGVPIRQFTRARLPNGQEVTRLEDAERFTPRVVAADFVSLEDGTGIVHIAPAFGDEDLQTGRREGLAFVQPVDLQGAMIGDFPFAGKFVKEADRDIIRDLRQRRVLYRNDVYVHTYPFCWRCDSPLLYYAKSSWYIRTTAMKDRLVSGNEEINWYPAHFKEGRFGDWLRNNVDWAISRERFWGTPIPIWKCESCDALDCIGSKRELEERAVPEDRGKVPGLDLHRPYVDDIRVACRRCGGVARRVPEVMDAWFDSGAMPYGQFHYPFEKPDLLQSELFPADYICEAVDQTRGWFYSLHALSTLIAGGPCYKNVICLGHILDEKGEKMSKHRGNVVEPWSVIDQHGADALRWYLFTATSAGEPRRFSSRLVGEVVRQFFLTLWNTYVFFVTYANLDGFNPKTTPRPEPSNDLDRWILSELNALVADVDGALERYNPTDAGRRIQDFVDVLSNWYVRRSRRRFWRSDDPDDTRSAYHTLYECLATVSRLAAPFAPFVSEAIYQNLVRKADPEAPESVHLADYPVADELKVDRALMDATRLAVRVSSLGRAARQRAGVKVRQPLARVVVKPRSPESAGLLERLAPQFLDELNVKALVVADETHPLISQALAQGKAEGRVLIEGGAAALDYGLVVALDTVLTPELEDEGLARELVHRVQGLRRGAGFDIADRIVTYYEGDERASRVLETWADYIKGETLSLDLKRGAPASDGHSETVSVDGATVTLAVVKAG